ncbi:MAG: hypothetical protein LM593_04780 [Candidatus Verstraetearchaeota archaeon]|jgi:hypothetical protein|nr:hypothetical protein [Candidatus Verstraetearchaeota archaeon]
MRRKGFSLPMNVIILTSFLILITTLISIKSIMFISSINKTSSSNIIHMIIEEIYASNPGTSITILINEPRSIICNNSTIYFSSYIFDFPDPMNIISNIVIENDLIIITYNIKINDFIIPAGLHSVTISKEIDNSVKVYVNF